MAVVLPRVTVQELMRKLAQQNIRLFDVRSAVEYAGGHVLGSVNLPLQAICEGSQLPCLSSQETVYLICSDASKADAAAQLLREQGICDVWVVAGGLKSWSAFGYPLIKGSE